MNFNAAFPIFKSGSCHLDWASNVEIGVECQIFVIAILFNCCGALQFGAHSRYFKGPLTQKRSFLVICTISEYKKKRRRKCGRNKLSSYQHNGDNQRNTNK